MCVRLCSNIVCEDTGNEQSVRATDGAVNDGRDLPAQAEMGVRGRDARHVTSASPGRSHADIDEAGGRAWEMRMSTDSVYLARYSEDTQNAERKVHRLRKIHRLNKKGRGRGAGTCPSQTKTHAVRGRDARHVSVPRQEPR